MKEFTIKTLAGDVTFNFPTSIADIDSTYVNAAVEHIKPANDYSVVGLITHEKLSSLILSAQKNKKGFSTGVIPIFVTGGHTDSEFHANIPFGSKLVIDSSDLMRGHHLVVPKNILSFDNFLRMLSVAKDKDIYQNAVAFGDEVYFIDFKLVPNTDIKAYYLIDEDTTKKLETIAKKYKNEHPLIISQ